MIMVTSAANTGGSGVKPSQPASGVNGIAMPVATVDPTPQDDDERTREPSSDLANRLEAASSFGPARRSRSAASADVRPSSVL
jgi:hypothetical protein